MTPVSCYCWKRIWLPLQQSGKDFRRHLRMLVLLSYNRQCLNSDDCLEYKRKDRQNCSVLFYLTVIVSTPAVNVVVGTSTGRLFQNSVLLFEIRNGTLSVEWNVEICTFTYALARRLWLSLVDMATCCTNALSVLSLPWFNMIVYRLQLLVCCLDWCSYRHTDQWRSISDTWSLWLGSALWYNSAASVSTGLCCRLLLCSCLH